MGAESPSPNPDAENAKVPESGKSDAEVVADGEQAAEKRAEMEADHTEAEKAEKEKAEQEADKALNKPEAAENAEAEPSENKDEATDKDEKKDEADKTTADASKTETPEAGTDAPLASMNQWDRFAYRMAANIAKNPKSITSSIQLFTLKVLTALSKETPWVDKLDKRQLSVLSAMGMGIKENTNDNGDVVKSVEWGEADPNYVMPPWNAIDVLNISFGETLTNTLIEKTIDNKTTIKDFRDKVMVTLPAEQKAKAQKLLDAMMDSGAKENGKFISFLESKSRALKDKLNTVEEAPSQPS